LRKDAEEERSVLNVVIVDGDVSYPASSGKRLRTLNLMLRLARRHHITYLARGNGDAEQAARAVEFLAGQGVDAQVIDDPLPRKSGLAFHGRLAANLLSPLPYSVASHDSPRMRQAVRAHAASHRVDLWQIEWSAYFPTLPPGSGPRTVLNAHNVDALIWQRYYEMESHPARRWYIGGQWRKFERFERRIFAAVGRVAAVSPEDAALVREVFGVTSVDVVDNGIDAAHYAGLQGKRRPETILFLGSLDWRPNLDAVRLLLDEVFPAVRAIEPAARLCIVGRHAPAWLAQRVRDLPGAELHADVPDVRPYLAESGVLAVPLRIGGGSRLKILEALAAGLPVVSTRVGAEGLCLRPGRDLTVVEGTKDMAAALVRAIRMPGEAQAQAEQGRRLVLERYDWGVLADKLEGTWESCLAGQGAAEPAGVA
jgi:glycosyltransferase involved in cell wall biosynthesis